MEAPWLIKIPYIYHCFPWLVVPTPLKNMKVGWDYYSEYNIWKVLKFMFQTTRLQ